MSNANLVRQLRDKTGAGFVECKKALDESEDNLEKAIDYLRKRGLAAAQQKVGRITNDGRVHAYIHGQGKIGVLVEVNCETDFVARTDDFQNLINDIAMQIAAASPRYVSCSEIEASVLEKEKSILRAQAAGSGKPEPVIEKIVEGRLGKFYEECCLLEQRFIKDPDKSVEQLVKEAIAKLGENITVRRFVRFQLGEQTKEGTT